MQIADVRTVLVDIPFERPLVTSIHRIAGVQAVLVLLDTDQGLTGESYLFAFGLERVRVLQAMVHALAPRVVGRDPVDREALWADLWRDINFLGHKGIAVFGLAAVDTACWDIAGKAAGLSVSAMLGRVRDRVPAYASEGLWLSLDIDELQAEARALVAKGFKAVKMRLGKPAVSEDAERVAAVREAIGADVTLMADANQGLTVNHAIRLGRALEPCGLAWFEEPVQAYDLAGSGSVAAALDTPVASGETEYARYGFRDMLAAGAADIWMPDLQRAGGISEFMKIGHLAAAHDIPVSPHIFTEPSLQLCGALANVTWSEHMPWFQPLYNEAMELVDGDLMIPDRPGLGFTFDADAVARYAVR